MRDRHERCRVADRAASLAAHVGQGFIVDMLAAGIMAAIFVAALAYYWFYSRHHLVANAPEEEFATLKAAESELD